MPNQLSRRDMLKLTGLTAAAAITPSALTSCAAAPGSAAGVTSTAKSASGSVPRNVIFMVADGMSTGVLSLSESFLRLVRDKDQSTHWAQIMRRPEAHQGMVETYSLNSIVTDSAAAASAWGSGSRVNNGTLNMLPNNQHITPLAKLVRDSGRRAGLVTTCTITHATPAGFAVNVQKRDNEAEVALQYLDGVDVLLGGGSKFFAADTRKDKHDLFADFKKSGYALLNHRDQLLAAGRTSPQAKMLGAFSDKHLPFTIDQRNDPSLIASVPTLAEMTTAAIASLSQSDKGFFLMVEGGKVDHCAHANDAAGAMWEQLAFDDAIGVALNFAQQHGDTLIVLTTDHGNSNPGLNGTGGKLGDSNVSFARLANFTASTYTLMDQFKAAGKTITAEQITQIIQNATAIQISDDHAQAMLKVLTRQSIGELNRQHANPVGALGQILGNHTSVGWTGTSHTADYANITAIGPGSERFAGLGKNTDAFAHITSFFNIDHVNPKMTPIQDWRSAVDADVYQHQMHADALV